jgi:hypothetical protein
MWGLSKVLRQLLSSIRCSKEDPGKETKTFERTSEKTPTPNTPKGKDANIDLPVPFDVTPLSAPLPLGVLGNFQGARGWECIGGFSR